MDIIYHSIGVVYTPFKEIEGMPIQPSGAQGVRGRVEIYPDYTEGLKDLDGFSHLILIYHFHRVMEAQMVVKPFLDTRPHGVFATRAPKRPNPIGLSVVRLLGIEGNVLLIENVDILNETPLLDIKPYVPSFDHPPVERVGWLEEVQNEVHHKRSDKRFR
jgi:tRNA-Thr(GGU) m(6)t(6)A37 methyltransferase TsaA